jgi:hypothetical protein
LATNPIERGKEAISEMQVRRDSAAGLAYVLPIFPGKQEAWRRFCQELEGSRRCEYERSRGRLGITKEYIWFAQVPQGEIAIVYLEAAQPELVIAQLASSDSSFDRWFRSQLLELHGLDVSQLPTSPGCETVFMWQTS